MIHKARAQASLNYSANVIRYIRTHRKDITLKEIGECIGHSELFVCHVSKGSKNLTLRHLILLEKLLGQPLLLLPSNSVDVKLTQDIKILVKNYLIDR